MSRRIRPHAGNDPTSTVNLVALHSISLPCDRELITRLGEFGPAESATGRDCAFDLRRGELSASATPTGFALHVGSDSRAPLDLLAEEGTLKCLRLRGRESGFREHLDDLIRECPLFRWKHRRVALPTQASANVRVNPRPFTRDLVRQAVQVSNLIKQRSKLFVGNRHNRRRVRPPLDESCLTSPLVRAEQQASVSASPSIGRFWGSRSRSAVRSAE